jgi:tetratricopeptide (TPR) repeat protein
MPLFGGGKKEKRSRVVGHIEEILDDADKLLQGGDIDRAAAEYRRAHRTLYKEEKLEQDPLEYSKVFTRCGHGLFDTEEIERSIECFEKAAQLDPKNVDAWLSKGIAHLKTKQMLNYAVLCFNEVIKLKPNSTEAWENKAEALTIDGKKEEAIECYRKLLELNPNHEVARKKLDDLAPVTVEAIDKQLVAEPTNLDAWKKKVELLLKAGKTAQAVEAYLKISELNPKDTSWLKMALDLQPDNVAAINKLLASDPKNVALIQRKATALLHKKRIADAIECYATLGELEPDKIEHFQKMLELNPHNLVAMEKIISLEPKNVELRERRAGELITLGRKQEAVQAYEELAKMQPGNPKFTEALRKLKPDEMAGIDEALAKNPKDKAALLKKAQLHEKRGEKDAARAIFQRLLALEPKNLDYIDNALRFSPDDVNLLTSKGDLAYEKEDFKKALDAFDRLSQLQPGDENNWHNKGAVLYNMDRFADAVVAFDKVIAMNQDDTVAWLTKGVCQYKLGKYEESIASLNNVVKRDMNEPAAWFYKACAEAKRGNLKPVVPFLKRAIEIDASYKETAAGEEALAPVRGDPSVQALLK